MSRIALIGENSVSYINELVNIWNSGSSVALLDWRIPIKTAVEMMKEAGIVECHIEKNCLCKIPEPILKEIRFVPFEMSNEISLLPEEIYNNFRANYSIDEAVVIYSSGTTGKSKGIILSHYAMNINADAIINYMNLKKNDCICIVKPLSHSSTLTGELLVALKTKTKLLITPTIVPPRYVLNNIQVFAVTIICVNPTLLSLFSDEYTQIKYDLSSLKKIYVSGSVLDDAIYSKAHSIFDFAAIYNVYGLSEAGPRVSAQREDCCKRNSVGKAISGVEIAIVDEQGKEVHSGEKGVIHVNTKCRYTAYVSGKEKFKSLYKGWLNTGDIGYFDEEKELHIVNRIDDVIIINSYKVYPSEVEQQIMRHTAIRECIVSKVEFGEREFIGCLYVSDVKFGADLYRMLRDFLALYEIPKYFLQCDVLPRTTNGKISKKAVKCIWDKYFSQAME